jgi:hypothetical protein
MSLRHKIAIAACCVGVVLLATPAVSYSAANSLPAGTKVTGKLKKGTDMTFAGTIDGVGITVTCTSFVASGKVPKAGATEVPLSAPPKITGCTDSLGGTDTIKDNSTNGKWTLTADTTAPYTITLTIPKAGATFSSNALPTCVITAAPSKPDPITGSYNDTAGTVTVKKGPIPTSAAGCTATAATTSATIVLTPNPGPPPF